MAIAATNGAYVQWLEAGDVDADNAEYSMMGAPGGWQMLCRYELTVQLMR